MLGEEASRMPSAGNSLLYRYLLGFISFQTGNIILIETCTQLDFWVPIFDCNMITGSVTKD